MVWTVIPDSDIDPDSPITTGLMTGIRDNFPAMANGDSGAPQIQSAAIANNAVGQPQISSGAVGQAQLKTTTGEVSRQATGAAVFTLAGGTYGFYPDTRSLSNNAGSRTLGAILGRNDYSSGWVPETVTGVTDTGFAQFITLYTQSNDHISYARQRYIQSSPPYDLGDGEIPLFIFVELDSSGNVISAYSAPEAPWHNNGITNCRADFYDSKGVGHRWRKDMSDIPFTYDEAKLDSIKLAEYTDAFVKAPRYAEEITQAIKQADMSMIPRPMNPSAGSTVVLLDPLSPLMLSMYELSIHDDFSVVELLHEGLIKIDNEPLNRISPPNVDTVGFSMRNNI